MKKSLISILAVLSLFLGCESTPHYDRTKVIIVGATYAKKPYATVKLFEKKEDIPGRYDVIAIMSVAGNPGEETLFMKAFLYHGADLGADGVLFYREGFAPGQDATYRGEAIHLK